MAQDVIYPGEGSVCTWEKGEIHCFADDMIFYIENPKDTTRKLLELINEYSEVTEYKINIQNSLAFLH